MIRRIGPGSGPDGELALSHFDGFPYIVTRIVSALHHIILLPARLAQEEMLEMGRRQAAANNLPTCLALSATSCAYVEADGDVAWSNIPPGASTWICNRLLPCVDIEDDHELLDRKERLHAGIEARKRDGFLFGDMTKGGHPATAEELEALSGMSALGVPKGLAPCQACGMWRGICLDPNPLFRNQVMTVSCRCENDNLCARCGRPLYEFKLNANYLGADGQVWHTPGFSGLSHRCPDLSVVGPQVIARGTRARRRTRRRGSL